MRFARMHSPEFLTYHGARAGAWRFVAPKGRTNLAQAIGLGFKDHAIRRALKGRANACRKSFPDSQFIPTDRLNIDFVVRPFRARP